MLATARKKVPAGAKWLHEMVFDGVRVQAHLVTGRATLYTRDGEDCTQRFPAIAEAVQALPANHAIIDGVPRDRMVCYAFDLLFLDGFDTRSATLVERKRVLEGFIAEAGHPRLAYSEHLSDGETMLRHARKIGASGIVCKAKDAPYRSGRTSEWIEVASV